MLGLTLETCFKFIMDLVCSIDMTCYMSHVAFCHGGCTETFFKRNSVCPAAQIQLHTLGCKTVMHTMWMERVMVHIS